MTYNYTNYTSTVQLLPIIELTLRKNVGGLLVHYQFIIVFTTYVYLTNKRFSLRNSISK